MGSRQAGVLGTAAHGSIHREKTQENLQTAPFGIGQRKARKRDDYRTERRTPPQRLTIPKRGQEGFPLGPVLI